jgi:hypothetical protein
MTADRKKEIREKFKRQLDMSQPPVTSYHYMYRSAVQTLMMQPMRYWRYTVSTNGRNIDIQNILTPNHSHGYVADTVTVNRIVRFINHFQKRG